jgi:hypothetical protein
MRVRWLAGWAIWLVGCSTSSSGGLADAMAPNGGGGAGGSGGVRAQAALSVYLTTFANAMAGMACPAIPHWVNVPFAAGGQQTTSMRKSTSAVDGVDDVSVSCTVKESAGVFDVTASIKAPAVNPTTGMPVPPTLLTLSTSIADGSTSKGSLSVQDNNTGTTYASVNDANVPDAACTFSVKPVNLTEQLAVAPGRIWASVSCPRFRDPTSSNANELCSIGTGYIVLENCNQ